MLTMNRATVLGYAGRNPEMRRLTSGDEVALLSLATNERFKRRDGSDGESTEWHAVVAFGRAAETVRERVRKGDPVLVEGRIATRVWTDRKGAEHRTTEIVVAGPSARVNVLTKRKADPGDDAPPGGAAAADAAQPADPEPTDAVGTTAGAETPDGTDNAAARHDGADSTQGEEIDASAVHAGDAGGGDAAAAEHSDAMTSGVEASVGDASADKADVDPAGDADVGTANPSGKAGANAPAPAPSDESAAPPGSGTRPGSDAPSNDARGTTAEVTRRAGAGGASGEPDSDGAEAGSIADPAASAVDPAGEIEGGPGEDDGTAGREAREGVATDSAAVAAGEADRGNTPVDRHA